MEPCPCAPPESSLEPEGLPTDGQHIFIFVFASTHGLKRDYRCRDADDWIPSIRALQNGNHEYFMLVEESARRQSGDVGSDGIGIIKKYYKQHLETPSEGRESPGVQEEFRGWETLRNHFSDGQARELEDAIDSSALSDRTILFDSSDPERICRKLWRRLGREVRNVLQDTDSMPRENHDG